MKRLMPALAIALTALWLPAAAQADFGLNAMDVTFTAPDGSPAMQAGSHPFAMSTSFKVNTVEPEPGKVFAAGAIKDLDVKQPAGFIGDQTAVPVCSTQDFLAGGLKTQCSNSAAVGMVSVTLGAKGGSNNSGPYPVYNLAPPPGVPSKLGFIVSPEVPITVEVGVDPEPPYELIASVHNNSQVLEIFGTTFTLWGVPADPAHDPYRGHCLKPVSGPSEDPSAGNCPAGVPERPFLTMPRSCTGPLLTIFKSNSWLDPATYFEGRAETHDDSEPPAPLGTSGCGKLAFNPSITAQPTTKAASSPTGLDFSLDVADEGLANPEGIAGSDIKKTVVTLPEGFSTNPSIAEGLGVCTQAQLEAESAKSAPGEGCPNAAKIGSVEVETPLLSENVNGALYIAKPYENPFGSLLALYLVIKNPNLGIIVTQAIKVEPDPLTGQLRTVAEDLPQLPFSHFRLHFREGARSPLASPPGCGTYAAKAELYPWSGGAPITTTSAFEIITGPDAGPCPTGGTPPFKPGLIAGTINNRAGSYSPFNLRMFRSDSEQEITHFSIKLPPGLVGKLAGIPYCPDAQIAAAKARTGPHGGREELDSPSCPAASEVGRTLAGAGVGPSLTYAPGKIYLAGPYNGSNLSIAAITAGVVGPFDIGTVVVRQALKINPETAEVFIDATGSDPIPHIIQGIPVHLRDIRAYVDKPDFVLNPTNCTRTSTASTVLGSGLNFSSEADDNPITVTSPFQAADCASLGFAPKLALSLKGGTKRGATPAFKAVLTYPKGSYANIGAAQVTLPHSAFLEQSHIKTICTRVQFKEGKVPGEKCPAASIYGSAKAVTPILSEPLQGPVYLRSSSHNLPDLVVALHNAQVDVALAGRIDSVKGGRIRNTFESVPDAPVTSFTLEMQGGKKGLLVNSTNLCKSTNRAIAHFTGQNGKVHDFNPVVKPDCKKAKKKHKKGKRHS